MESEDPKNNEKEKEVGIVMTIALLLFAVSITFIIALEFFTNISK